MNQNWQNLPLPPNWEAKYDPGLARYFYINHKTRSTQWNDPRIDYYAKQHHNAENIPMRVMVQPKCATCRNNNVARAGEDCSTCARTKQEAAAKEAFKRQEEEKKRRAEAEKKRKEELERKKREARAKLEAERRKEEEERRKAEAAKVPTEAMKREAKRKLTQQFPKASSLIIEMAIETTNCDVAKAASVLKMLGDDDSPKPAKKPVKKEKKTSPAKKAPQPATSMPASRGVSPSGVFFEVNFSDTVSGTSTSSSSTKPWPVRNLESTPPQPSKPAQKMQKTSPQKPKKVDGRVKFAPVVIKTQTKTFNSHLARGPDPSLVVGHNVDLLIDNYVKMNGQDGELRKGTNPAYVGGPGKHISNKENIAEGPDPTNVNGPQMLLYQGPMSMGTAL